MRIRIEPITLEDVDEVLHNLHPNKDDWTAFERSNMERALYLFLIKRSRVCAQEAKAK